MTKRICPKCGASWYSADSSPKVWTCNKCGAEVPKSAEVELGEERIIRR